MRLNLSIASIARFPTRYLAWRDLTTMVTSFLQIRNKCITKEIKVKNRAYTSNIYFIDAEFRSFATFVLSPPCWRMLPADYTRGRQRCRDTDLDERQPIAAYALQRRHREMDITSLVWTLNTTAVNVAGRLGALALSPKINPTTRIGMTSIIHSLACHISYH